MREEDIGQDGTITEALWEGLWGQTEDVILL